MGGFEGADHLNSHGTALDMNRATGHADRVEDDHRLAAERGILTLRESIGWRLAEPAPNTFDLARTLRTARSARDHGVQVLWTLMHYGTPADLSLHDDASQGGDADGFCRRFVRFASTVAEAIAPLCDAPPVYNLINEIGFLAWAASETNMIHPYRGAQGDAVESSQRSGYRVKRRLVRAVIEAIAAIRRIDPRARFLHVEPLVHVVAPPGAPELAPLAAQVRSYQWQVWDMIAGRIEPQFGGDPAALDLIGVNHYHSGQWEVATEERLWWHERDPRRVPLAALLGEAWAKYGRPLMLAETSHFGDGRTQWLHETAHEVRQARAQGIPVHGICLYPLIDRPEWDDAAHWHHSGLWDCGPQRPQESQAPGLSTGSSPDPAPPPDGAPSTSPWPQRALCPDYAAALSHWQHHLPHPAREGLSMTCLIVFSHLRWNFVYQRPQHLMSRLAKHYRVLFVEEPVKGDGASRLDVIAHGPSLQVVVPCTAIDAPGFHDDQLAAVQGLLAEHLREEAIDDYVVWFYTPMALPLLAPLHPRAVVYDCMDELSAFLHAPRQLRQRETALMKRADFVLTGGPALYEAKRHQHPKVHCLPSSVDAEHFSPGRLVAGSEHEVEAARLHAGMPHPRLGFFGVIDERFDIDLLALLARAHPEWQLVMVGPVVKIDPARLPRATNIHWLGMQSYERLPYLLAQWDLCLMPFALNDSTRFISPTKTLEYMAGEKPIVSTPVHDVIGLYGDTVRIAPAGPAFITACEDALTEGRSQRNRRIGEMLATVQRSSWDRSADSVHALIEAELRESSPMAIPLRAIPTYVPPPDVPPVGVPATFATEAGRG